MQIDVWSDQRPPARRLDRAWTTAWAAWRQELAVQEVAEDCRFARIGAASVYGLPNRLCSILVGNASLPLAVPGAVQEMCLVKPLHECFNLTGSERAARPQRKGSSYGSGRALAVEQRREQQARSRHHHLPG